MLSQDKLTQYLLGRSLIDAASIVDGELRVAAAGSRRICNITRTCGASFLLKQKTSTASGAYLAHEAAIYQWLHAQPLGSHLSRYLPQRYDYDPHAGILVLELLEDAEDLRAYHVRLGRFPVAPAEQLGHALGALHRLTGTVENIENCPGLNAADASQPAWVLKLHQPDIEQLRDTSAAGLEFIKAMQASADLCQHLDDLRIGWQTTALIHGDIKWDNCLVRARTGSRHAVDVRIVDWEHARRGDPCWDAGSVFTDYLIYWFFSLPISPETSAEYQVEHAYSPLERMHPAVRAFWRAYALSTRLDGDMLDQWLMRAVAYSAARLIQTGFEYMLEAECLTDQMLTLLQLSLNILRNPRETAVHLLGLPVHMTRSA